MKMQKSAIFVKKIQNKYVKDKKYRKVRHHFIILGNIEVPHVAYVV